MAACASTSIVSSCSKDDTDENKPAEIVNPEDKTSDNDDSPSVVVENNDWVDLGLPSGTLWAKRNVGARVPEEYGYYFAWGETRMKDDYSWSTYKYCDGSYNTLTKYCTESSYGFNGFTDGKTELDPEDDAATANLGADWRTPSMAQLSELMLNTDRAWVEVNKVPGWRMTSKKNGKSIFLPAAGWRSGSAVYGTGVNGIYGYYWISKLCTGNYHSSEAYALSFGNNYFYSFNIDRFGGRSVRPVRVSR